MKANGSLPTRLTNSPQPDFDPAWSPDGARIAFSSGRPGDFEVFTMNSDGSNQTNISNHPDDDLEPAWSPDGSKIAFRTNRTGNNEIFVMNPNGSSQANVTNDPPGDSSPGDEKPSWQGIPVPVPNVTRARTEEGRRAVLTVRLPEELPRRVTYEYETRNGTAKGEGTSGMPLGS